MQLPSEKECAVFGYSMYFYALLHCFLNYCAALQANKTQQTPQIKQEPKNFSLAILINMPKNWYLSNDSLVEKVQLKLQLFKNYPYWPL